MTEVDTTTLLAQMTSRQVEAAIARGRTTVVVPFGALEQHGPHLPLDTDAVLGDRLGPMLAERLDALCAPTIRVGCSWHHLAFAGTLSIRPETLLMIVEDLVDSLTRHGFRRIVLLPTHGGNEGPLLEAAQRSQRDGVTIIVPSLRATVQALLSRAKRRGAVPGDAGGHAGELETSLLLALAPNLVKVDLLEPGYTGPSMMRPSLCSLARASMPCPPTASWATREGHRRRPVAPISPRFWTRPKKPLSGRREQWTLGAGDPHRASPGSPTAS